MMSGKHRKKRTEKASEETAWGESPPRPVFVALEATGPDPAIDDLLGIRAVRSEETFERSCESDEARAIWRDFERFAEGHLVVTPHAAGFECWAAHLAGWTTGLPKVCGLSDVAALLFPGRLAARRENLVGEFSSADPDAPPTADQQIATPLGTTWSPPVGASVLVRLFELEPDDLVLLHEDGTADLIEAGSWVAATRSSVRASAEELPGA